jgi:hypothetical protein
MNKPKKAANNRTCEKCGAPSSKGLCDNCFYEKCRLCDSTELMYGGRGLCSPCYYREHRKEHPEQYPTTPLTLSPEVAKQVGVNTQCGHLDHDHYAQGYCVNCYMKARRLGLLIPARPKTQINTCGHPDRKHRARGMCGSCYELWRLQNSVPGRKKRPKKTT